ncbi:hypothetical protein Syun_028393 [Stephania yunnanensis]|uniref:Uncharacterized protein n=1 Tax=Stephania yunnanensis TaxID=152371 RepID=A0AAP0EMI8_9MAGN
MVFCICDDSTIYKESLRSLSTFVSIFIAFKVLNMMACWAEDPTSDVFKYHLARIPDYLWVAEDGMKMQVLKSWFKEIHLAILNACIVISLKEHGLSRIKIWGGKSQIAQQKHWR